MLELGVAHLPLLGRHCKWVIDGASFLEHLADLAVVRIQPVCRTCGLVPTARPLVESARYVVSCGCRAGEVRTDRPLVVEPLLLTLGWTLVCAACGESIQGGNAQGDPVFRLTCPCTTREYRVAPG